MNRASIEFRRAGAADVAALTALQWAAFARNRAILGVEPLPLLADYRDIVATKECWLAEGDGRLIGALIVEPDGDALMIWSIAVLPEVRGVGFGPRLMALAESLALERGFDALILHTGVKLTENIAWYKRQGFVRTSIEERPDRKLVHMKKLIIRKR